MGYTPRAEEASSEAAQGLPLPQNAQGGGSMGGETVPPQTAQAQRLRKFTQGSRPFPPRSATENRESPPPTNSLMTASSRAVSSNSIKISSVTCFRTAFLVAVRVRRPEEEQAVRSHFLHRFGPLALRKHDLLQLLRCPPGEPQRAPTATAIGAQGAPRERA